MPRIFEYLAFIIRFYTNEHLPIHVHVQKQEREIKAEFFFSEDGVILVFRKVKGKEPLTEQECREVSVFLKAYNKQIVDKWNKVFVYHQKVSCQVINKKIKKKS
jgi:Domain of unknown function (DUF4160)